MEQLKIIQVTPEELKDIISEGLKAQIEELKNSQSGKDPDELLTRKETAKLLKINLATLWSWSKAGKIKSVGISNRVYYRRSAIDDALIKIN